MEVKLRRAQAPKKYLKLEKSKNRKAVELVLLLLDFVLSQTVLWVFLESFALAERKSKPRKRGEMSLPPPSAPPPQVGSRNKGRRGKKLQDMAGLPVGGNCIPIKWRTNPGITLIPLIGHDQTVPRKGFAEASTSTATEIKQDYPKAKNPFT